MAVKKLVDTKRSQLNAEGKAMKKLHKGKPKNSITLPDLKDMILPLLEREGFYDPTP